MPKTAKSRCTHPRHARYYNYISKGNTQNGYACSDCEMEGLSAPLEPAVLAPGVYKLAAPLVNAGKDGRSRDWHSLASFPAGTYYVRQNLRDLHGDASEWTDYGCRIERSGYGSVRPDHAGYDALAMALVADEGTTEEFLTAQKVRESYAGDAEVILTQLINSGKVSREDVLKAMSEVEAN